MSSEPKSKSIPVTMPIQKKNVVLYLNSNQILPQIAKKHIINSAKVLNVNHSLVQSQSETSPSQLASASGSINSNETFQHKPSSSSLPARSPPEHTEEKPEKTEDKHVWSENETYAWFALYEENAPLLENRSKFKTQKQMWKHIAKELQALGINVTEEQAANRGKALRRQYNDLNISNNKSGMNSQPWKYEDKCAAIFGVKDNATPRCVMGKDGMRVKRLQVSDNNESINAHLETIDVTALTNERIAEELEMEALENGYDTQASTNEATSTSINAAAATSSQHQSQKSNAGKAKPTKPKSKATTAQAVMGCQSTLKEIHSSLKDKSSALINRYDKELENANEFRRDLLKRKDEKNELLKELLDLMKKSKNYLANGVGQ